MTDLDLPVLRVLIRDGGAVDLSGYKGGTFSAGLRDNRPASPHWYAESTGANPFEALSTLLLTQIPELEEAKEDVPHDPTDPEDEPLWRAYQRATVLSAALFEEYCRVSSVARERWDAWEHRPGGLADKLASLSAAEALSAAEGGSL